MSGWWHTKIHPPKAAIADERLVEYAAHQPKAPIADERLVVYAAHQSKALIADEVIDGSFRSPYVRGTRSR